MAQGQCCKLGSVAVRHDLGPSTAEFDSLDEELEARWTGSDGFQEHGYRTLTEWFNRRVLKRVYDQHGRETTGTRLESEYEALMGADELTRLEVVDDLAADGIDADSLLQDTISWSTMRTHLTECLEGTKERAKATTDWERDTIEIARGHAKGKIAEAVASLGSKNKLAGGTEAAISVDIQLECDQCSTSVPLVVALDRGYVCGTHHKQEVPA